MIFTKPARAVFGIVFAAQYPKSRLVDDEVIDEAENDEDEEEDVEHSSPLDHDWRRKGATRRGDEKEKGKLDAAITITPARNQKSRHAPAPLPNQATQPGLRATASSICPVRLRVP